MNARTFLTLFATVALLTAVEARAEIRVAVVNTGKAFNEMQETKDLKQKLDAERIDFEHKRDQQQKKLTDLRSQRDLLKPESPQYADLDRQYAQAAIQADVWSRVTQAQVQRMQKQEMRDLFNKIVAASEEVAKQKHFDIVIADQRRDLPDNLDHLSMEQVQAAINIRNVLYASPKVDITEDVVALLDEKYKAGGVTTTPSDVPPAPAIGDGSAPQPDPAVKP